MHSLSFLLPSGKQTLNKPSNKEKDSAKEQNKTTTTTTSSSSSSSSSHKFTDFFHRMLNANLTEKELHRERTIAKELKDGEEVVLYAAGYMRSALTYALNQWEGMRFGYLLCDLCTLLRRFSGGYLLYPSVSPFLFTSCLCLCLLGGWYRSNVRFLRYILSTLVTRVKDPGTVRVIRNNVGGSIWSVSPLYSAFFLFFSFFLIRCVAVLLLLCFCLLPPG
jgi:hypothetical protein